MKNNMANILSFGGCSIVKPGSAASSMNVDLPEPLAPITANKYSSTTDLFAANGSVFVKSNGLGKSIATGEADSPDDSGDVCLLSAGSSCN